MSYDNIYKIVAVSDKGVLVILSFFLRRRFISTKQIYKKSYNHYQKHYIQKKRNKGKKRLEILIEEGKG